MSRAYFKKYFAWMQSKEARSGLSTFALAFEPYSDFNRLCCSEKFVTTVRHLEFLTQRIEFFLDSECRQAEQTDELALRLQHNRSFPAIRQKLLTVRLLPYESGFGPLHNETLTAVVPSVLKEAVDCSALILAAALPLQALESLSSKFVLKMITKVSEEIPFCNEEVEAIIHHLNSRFNALKTRIRFITSIHNQNPSRYFFQNLLEEKEAKLTIETIQEKISASYLQCNSCARNLAGQQLCRTL